MELSEDDSPNSETRSSITALLQRCYVATVKDEEEKFLSFGKGGGDGPGGGFGGGVGGNFGKGGGLGGGMVKVVVSVAVSALVVDPTMVLAKVVELVVALEKLVVLVEGLERVADLVVVVVVQVEDLRRNDMSKELYKYLRNGHLGIGGMCGALMLCGLISSLFRAKEGSGV
ncbi:hypothetical protein NE237_014562 [Protea cynaroides]|uniref:Uncharacterized protein n=1 Tax=Protea cynaroides TaxID=273540 RepID=A0A9Q0KCK3_9MAGN|nr:hypothetical protein NE237_014562 [Protea cynaroides]